MRNFFSVFWFAVELVAASALQAAEQRSGDAFLRDASFFTGAGNFSMDLSVSYERDLFETSSSVVSREKLTASNTLRYRIHERLQASLLLPARFVNDEYDEDGVVNNFQRSGMSDALVQLRYQMLREGLVLPDLLFALAYKSNYAAVSEGHRPGLGNGLAQWSYSLTAVKNLSPVVYYSTITFLQREQTLIKQRYVDPGVAFQYVYGAGYGFSDQVFLGVAVLGTYVLNAKVDRMNVRRQHALQLQFSNTILLGKHWFVEPLLRFGLTPEAPDVEMQLSFPLLW